MNEANNSQKPDGQEPVNEKASEQQSVSERNKSERKFFTGENVGVYSLLVGLIVVLLTLLFYTVSEIDATRAEITAVKDHMLERMDKDRAETLTGIQSLGESLRDGIRAGFAGIDHRVVSNDERIDNVYSREIELNQKRDEDDKKRDQEIDSLGNRVSSLEAAQESEG